MFKDEYQAMTTGSLGKYNLFKNNPFGYFVSSMTAGAFIGVGVLLAFTVGGLLTGQPYAKIMMAATFSVALSLVIMAGAELFTGNNMVLAAGVLRKEISAADMIKIWVFCWVGNLVGSVLIACIYIATGLASGDVGQCMADAAAAKMTAPAVALFARGILCNFLVCLAVWCGFRAKSDSGKLIMIFWCILAFFCCGFEHSVANMTLLTIGLFIQSMNDAISVGGYFFNLCLVTLGNIVGGALFVAVPYHIVSKEK